jgi:signal transduction histidine kinase
MLITNPPLVPKPAVDIKSVNIFLGMLAHEMRSQISGIYTITNMLLQEEKDAENASYYLSHINSLSSNVLHVLNNMVTTTDIDSAGINLKANLSSIKIREWLRAHIRQYDLTVVGKVIKLKLRIKRNVPVYITSDAVKLGQILRNLIDNALKYAPDGTSIYIDLSAEGKKHLSIHVTNKGCIIPADKEHLLFRPFQVLDQGMAGMGLGLYVSKLYAATLGGDLVLGNNTKGTTFSFLLSAAPRSK